MSYILDALRRADSERERGTVPGIHAQPVPAVSAQPASSGMRPWMWGVFGAAVLALGLFAWQALTRDSTPTVVVRSAAPPIAAAPAAVQPAPAVAPPAPAVVPPTSPLVPPGPEARVSPAAPRIQAPAGPTRARPDAGLASQRETPVRATAKPASAASIAAADSRVYAFNELPDTIRRELPPLTIGGSIYSDSAANRFLIINGRIFHENDKIAPELTLEQIKLKAAVLRYKGYRYGITY